MVPGSIPVKLPVPEGIVQPELVSKMLWSKVVIPPITDAPEQSATLFEMIEFRIVTVVVLVM